jgi:hypothetical protein
MIGFNQEWACRPLLFVRLLVSSHPEECVADSDV